MLKLHRHRPLSLKLFWLALSVLIAACAGGNGGDETPTPTVVLPSVTPEPATATATTSTPEGTATAPQATATPDPDTISDEALAYLQEALDIIEAHSLLRDEIDWPELRDSALERAAGAAEPADTYRAIEWALRELGDDHSYFMTPDEAEQRFQSHEHAPMPTGQVLGTDIGYLAVPLMASGGDDPERYAETAVELIRQHDEAGVCGWIVDLRDNGGGNMWPMIAGLGPLLGEGAVGYFVDPDGSRAAWSYEDGAAMEDGRTRTQGPAYQLRDPDAPVAVLTARGTASSGEAMVVAFRGREHTRSFGGDTYGVPTANGTFPLSDGAVMQLTMAEMADRDGNTYNAPIEPDVRISTHRSPIPEHDTTVGTAIEWLRAQPACN